MSINSSGKLKSKIYNKGRNSNICNEISPKTTFPVKSNFGFGNPHFEKPAPKERKESSKKSKECLKYNERTSIEKTKFKRPRKDDFSPKIALKNIKVVKNCSLIKKIQRKESDERNEQNKIKGKHSGERKKIVSDSSPHPGFSSSTK